MKLTQRSESAKRQWKRKVLAGSMLALLVFSSASPGWADVSYPEFKTSSRFSQAVQKITGITALSGWIANRIVHKELARHFDGNIDSRLKLYSGTDLMAGKARRFRLAGKELVYDDLLPLSELSLESDQDMPLYVKKGSKPFLLRPVKFKLHAVISEDDLNRMLKSERGRKLLTAMEVEIPPFGKHELDIMEPVVDFDRDRIVINSLVNKHESSRDKALPVQVSGKLSSHKSRLQLSDVDINVEGVGEVSEVARLVEAYFSELVDLSKIKVDRHKVRVDVNETRLVDNRLVVSATVEVKPEDKLIRQLLSASR